LSEILKVKRSLLVITSQLDETKTQTSKKKNKSSLYSLNTLLGVRSEQCLSLRLCTMVHMHQGCISGELLATCGRFDWLKVWTLYLLHQRRRLTTCAIWPVNTQTWVSEIWLKCKKEGKKITDENFTASLKFDLSLLLESGR